jgi:hypothetical protein
VVAVQPVVELGEITPEVCAAALGPGKRAPRDEADHRMRILDQRLQPRSIPDQPGVPPQGVATFP